MMKWIITGMILISTIFGLLNGRIAEVSNAALSGGKNAVELCIILLGSMCLWSGIMKVAEKSKFTDIICNILYPVTHFLFSGQKKGSDALKAISMNMTANFLGLGNAATPLGIEAMKQLKKSSHEEKSGEASDDMIVFVVLNTASIQLIPATVAALRLNHGAASPLDILPAVFITSLCSVFGALIFVKLISAAKKSKNKIFNTYHR